MNTNQLNCFVEVAKSLSFARAAEKLYISQPSVSNQISALENELGYRLFYRTKHKVELTSAGETFYVDAVEVLTRLAIASARSKTHDLRFSECLTIGYDSDVRIHKLPEILSQYRKAMPQVYVSNQLATFSKKSQMLYDNHLDVAFSAYESVQQNFQFLCMFKGSFTCVVPQSHRLASKSAVSLDDISRETHIFLSPSYCPPEMDRVQKELQIKCPDITVYFSDSVYLSSQMILAGLGIAVMPNFVCPNSEGLIAIPFETEQKISYGLAYKKENVPKKVSEFLHIVERVY